MRVDLALFVVGFGNLGILVDHRNDRLFAVARPIAARNKGTAAEPQSPNNENGPSGAVGE